MTDATDVVAELMRLSRAGGAGGLPPTLPREPERDNGPGMEAHIAKLEAHMEHVRDDLTKLAGLHVDMAALKTKVDHLPGKGCVVTAAVSTIGGVAALMKLLQVIGVLH